MSFETIVNQIESLPPIPESVKKVQELFAEGNVTIQTLVEVIEKDPILTSEILAKANAPIYSFSRQIVSVSQAVTLFGLTMVRGLLLAMSAYKEVDFTMAPYGITNTEFTAISNLQSALMFQWYMGVDIDRARTLIPIAFLMNMGKVVIAKEMVQSDYIDEFTREIKESGDIKEVERFYTGMTTFQINALLFKKWYFEDIFVKTMEYADDVENAPAEYKSFVEALDVVDTAINIKVQLSDESIDNAVKLVEKYGMDPERFLHTAQRLQRKYHEEGM